jgi:folate-binding protein YgfZ
MAKLSWSLKAMTTSILLEDRGVIEVSGTEAGKFLHNLVTNNVTNLSPGQACFAALLSPQGKIQADFFIFMQTAESYFLDCPKHLILDLIQRLKLYKLRSQVIISDRSLELSVYAFPDTHEPPAITMVSFARDSRASFGWRVIALKNSISPSATFASYETQRILLGLPSGGVDFAYGDAYPHETNMDALAGIDFSKGCYVGQEVVSRMKHRSEVRKRITRYHATPQAPPPGTPITADDIEIGLTGSQAGSTGLAMIRRDRLALAIQSGKTPMADHLYLDFPLEPG